MRPEELKMLLHSLLSNWEDEVVEFKRGGAGFSTGEIGEYFSALANEANLRCLPHAWLVFGVDNKTRKVVGTDYDASRRPLTGLEESSIRLRRVRIPACASVMFMSLICPKGVCRIYIFLQRLP